MANKEGREKFYKELEWNGWYGDEPFIWFKYDDEKELTLDGSYTLDTLKKIVAAWEKLNSDE